MNGWSEAIAIPSDVVKAMGLAKSSTHPTCQALDIFEVDGRWAIFMGALDTKPLKLMRRLWALCSKDKKMSAPLTTGIVERITILFRPDEVELVSSRLTDECGPNLTKYPELQERIRFAVLKLSHGDLNALQQAIDLAKLDWRDALVAAGFADDIKAHESWWPDGPMAPPT